MTEKRKSGNCLCGAVSVTVSLNKSTFDACHCGMCRRWGGGPALCVDASEGLEIGGQDNVAIYASSAWAERGFCKRCGTHLFYRLKDRSYCNVTLGILEGTEGFEFGSQIFIDRGHKGYEFANQTKVMTEAEVLAAFAKK